MNKKALGIDISKKKFDVALLRDGKLKHKPFSNDQAGHEALLAWLDDHGAIDVHACTAATGIYGEPAAEFLYEPV
ncbi:IS110 family transposase [Methylocaldum sp. MU1018]